MIAPTRTGLDRAAEVRAARTKLYGEILADWTAADRRALATLMHRLNEALDARSRTR